MNNKYTSIKTVNWTMQLSNCLWTIRDLENKSGYRGLGEAGVEEVGQEEKISELT